MKQNIIDKRRKQNWAITFFCESGSVIVQITLPSESQRSEGNPEIDFAFDTFDSTIHFAQIVCNKSMKTVRSICNVVDMAITTSDDFINILNNRL